MSVHSFSSGVIECEPPNNRLNKFIGTLHWNEKDYALDNDKIVLRGCRLRNTKWMYGVVVYAGHDTKLVQNSGMTSNLLHYNHYTLWFQGYSTVHMLWYDMTSSSTLNSQEIQSLSELTLTA